MPTLFINSLIINSLYFTFQNSQLFFREPPLHPLPLKPRRRGRDEGVLHRAEGRVLSGELMIID